jgi:hypothetical protein
MLPVAALCEADWYEGWAGKPDEWLGVFRDLLEKAEAQEQVTVVDVYRFHCGGVGSWRLANEPRVQAVIARHPPKFVAPTDPSVPRWARSGFVNLQTATVAIGDPAAFVDRGDVAGDASVGLDPRRITLFFTREDAEYPVERLILGSEVMGVRVEVVSDVADVAGAWTPMGVITVESPFVLVADPCHAKSAEMTWLLALATDEDVDFYPSNAIRSRASSWSVEVFVSSADGDELGVRLMRNETLVDVRRAKSQAFTVRDA